MDFLQRNAAAAPRRASGGGIWEAKRQADVSVLTKQKEELLATIDAERKKSAEATQAAQCEIDEATQWSEQFEWETTQTYLAVAKEIEALYSKVHSIDIETSFLFCDGARCRTACFYFVVDDVEYKSAILVYILDAKRVIEYLP